MDNMAIFLFGIILFAVFASLVSWMLFGPEEFKKAKRPSVGEDETL